MKKIIGIIISYYYRFVEGFIPSTIRSIIYFKYIEILNYIPRINIYKNKNQLISKQKAIGLAARIVKNYFDQVNRTEYMEVKDKITKENKHAWIFTFFTEQALKKNIYDGIILSILVDKENGQAFLIQCPHYKKHYVLKKYAEYRNNLDGFNELFKEYLW